MPDNGKLIEEDDETVDHTGVRISKIKEESSESGEEKEGDAEQKEDTAGEAVHPQGTELEDLATGETQQ